MRLTARQAENVDHEMGAWMHPIGLFMIALVAVPALTAVPSARAAAPFPDCPLIGPMANYAATGKPDWNNWDSALVRTTGNANEDRAIRGAVCIQSYQEKKGISDGSKLEISMNYNEALRQLGAEIVWNVEGHVVGHLNKDGKETWISAIANSDDFYRITEVIVEPLHRTLTAPSGNDYRLLGHMPGYTATAPSRKNYAEVTFSTAAGPVAVRGAVYEVGYQAPVKGPERKVTKQEILANYEAALRDLNAEFLRNDDATITARLDDKGKMVWLSVTEGRVLAVEEKPFQLSMQPPTADAMKDGLDKDGRVALYVNFDFAKATLKPDAQPIIAQVVELLKRNPDLSVSIDGHTDAVGMHDYNVKLSQDRAASVVAAIVAAGIDGSRLKSAGYGPDKPIAPNDTDEGRAKNRRVELVKLS